jgi:hypothetical protein
MGCKGPVTFQNCPVVRWNSGTNWPIGCGHPCIGCAEPDFWDRMTPFYMHLSGVPGFGIHSDIDDIGLLATAAVGGAFAAHGLVQLGKRGIQKRMAAKEPTPPTDAVPAEFDEPEEELAQDSEPPDAEPPDSAPPDAEPPDSAPPDAEPPDSEPPDAEPPDSEPPDSERGEGGAS